jgi:hypothetical protein
MLVVSLLDGDCRKQRSQYLVAYDYGQGGRWALVMAQSAREILDRFPELVVVEDRPGWMTDHYYRRLEGQIHDIDHPTGLLADILNERK